MEEQIEKQENHENNPNIIKKTNKNLLEKDAIDLLIKILHCFGSEEKTDKFIFFNKLHDDYGNEPKLVKRLGDFIDNFYKYLIYDVCITIHKATAILNSKKLFLFYKLIGIIPSEVFQKNSIKYYFQLLINYFVFETKYSECIPTIISNFIIELFDHISSQAKEKILNDCEYDFFQDFIEISQFYCQKYYNKILNNYSTGNEKDDIEAKKLTIKKNQTRELKTTVENIIFTDKQNFQTCLDPMINTIDAANFFHFGIEQQLNTLIRHYDEIISVKNQKEFLKKAMTPQDTVYSTEAYLKQYKSLLTKINKPQIFVLHSLIDIIYNEENIKFFIKILKSPVIANYYNNKTNEEINKLGIDYNSIITQNFLNTFKNDLRITEINDNKALVEIAKSLIFITPLQNYCRGITNNYLRIVINYEEIKINSAFSLDKTKILVKAYCLIVLLHESNHFIRRYFHQQQEEEKISTPRINLNDLYNGGQKMFLHIFGNPVINNISLEQANYLLDENNWNSVENFNKKLFEPDNPCGGMTFMITTDSKSWGNCCIRNYK